MNEKNAELTTDPVDWRGLTKFVNDTASHWQPIAEKFIDNQRMISADVLEREKLNRGFALWQLAYEFMFLAALLTAISLSVWLLAGKDRWDIAEKLFYLTAGFFGGRSFLIIRKG